MIQSAIITHQITITQVILRQRGRLIGAEATKMFPNRNSSFYESRFLPIWLGYGSIMRSSKGSSPHRSFSATFAEARGAVAVGALAVGAAAVGGFAIGRLSVGRLAIGKAAIGRLSVKRLEVEELEIGRLTVREGLPE
jgi:hypothetical protein